MKFKLMYTMTFTNGVRMVADECEADTPFSAGCQMEEKLKARIGKKNFNSLKSAEVVDENGDTKAMLQIADKRDPVTGKPILVPYWGTWLTIR